jgi:O-methyltransferase
MMTLFQKAFHLAHYIFPIGGTCLEFGVYRGDTFVYQAEQKHPNDILIGFDSWQGLPADTTWRPERHKVGEFQARKSEVVERLHGHDNWKLVDGFFCDTLTSDLQQTISNVIFVNIDVDLYQSTKEVLTFIEPLLQIGTILYCDDWKDPQDNYPEPWGEHKAFGEWTRQADIETIEVNPVNQRYMVVTRNGNQQLPHDTMCNIRYTALRLKEVDD